MSDPKDKLVVSKDAVDCDVNSIDCAEKKLESSVASVNPEWVDENDDCPSCTSLGHEMADPHFIPEEIAKGE